MQALDPTPNESLRNSSYTKWADMSRALQEAVEDIHLCHVRLHFDLYHGPQVSFRFLKVAHTSTVLLKDAITVVTG